MLDVVQTMRGMLAAIEKRDPDLARQLRQAASGVVLNIAEEAARSGVCGRRAPYGVGSARETLACLRVAETFGYVQACLRSWAGE